MSDLTSKKLFRDRFVDVWYELTGSPAMHTLRYSNALGFMEEADQEIAKLQAENDKLTDTILKLAEQRRTHEPPAAPKEYDGKDYRSGVFTNTGYIGTACGYIVRDGTWWVATFRNGNEADQYVAFRNAQQDSLPIPDFLRNQDNLRAERAAQPPGPTHLKVGDRVRVKRWNSYGIIKTIGYELEPPYMADAFERERDIEPAPTKSEPCCCEGRKLVGVRMPDGSMEDRPCPFCTSDETSGDRT